MYDGDDVVLVFDESSSLTHRYLHGDAIDQVFADDSISEILWSLADNQGTVRDVVNYDPVYDNSNVANHLEFDAFGNITAESNGSVEFRYAYTGRFFDADTDLQYNRARWYDAQVGRWISEDPIGFAAGDLNINRYVGNSPANGTDPTGLEGLFGNFGQAVVNQATLPFRIGIEAGTRAAEVANDVLNTRFPHPFPRLMRRQPITTAPFHPDHAAREFERGNPDHTTTFPEMVVDDIIMSHELWGISAQGAAIALTPVAAASAPARIPGIMNGFRRVAGFFRAWGQAIVRGIRNHRERNNAEQPRNVSDVIQNHHAIPWNNNTFNHQLHPLVRQAGVNLRTLRQNIRPLQGHSGRHSPSYHREIQRRMDEAFRRVAGRGQEAANNQLSNTIDRIWRDIANGTLKPYDHKDVIVVP